MSDTGRKDMSSKISETVTPDSMKSSSQKAKEGVTGAADKVARGGQPDESKSSGQDMADKLGRGKDEQQHGGSGGGVMDSLKHATGMDKK